MDPSIRQRNSAKGQSIATILQSPGVAKPLLAEPQAPSLISWADLPDWSKDNEYIHTGFRPISNSYWKCMQSLSYLHNETCNIYSHLLATLWVFALAVYYYKYSKEHYPQANQDDLVVFALLFLGGTSCFAMSTIYHILSNHSHAVHDFCHKLDLLGIVTVTSGCFPPGLWYTFPCASRCTKFIWIGVYFHSSLEKSLARTAGTDSAFIGRFASTIPCSSLHPFRKTLSYSRVASTSRSTFQLHGFIGILSYRYCNCTDRVDQGRC